MQNVLSISCLYNWNNITSLKNGPYNSVTTFIRFLFNLLGCKYRRCDNGGTKSCVKHLIFFTVPKCFCKLGYYGKHCEKSKLLIYCVQIDRSFACFILCFHCFKPLNEIHLINSLIFLLGKFEVCFDFFLPWQVCETLNQIGSLVNLSSFCVGIMNSLK